MMTFDSLVLSKRFERLAIGLTGVSRKWGRGVTGPEKTRCSGEGVEGASWAGGGEGLKVWQDV